MCTVVYMYEHQCAQTPAPANLEISQLNLPACDLPDGIGNAGTLPQHTHDAKPKPADLNATAGLVAVIMAIPPRYSVMKSALCDYVLSDEPLAVIAKRHGYTGPAIAYWIWKLCLPARGRGRPILQQPTSAHRRMLALARTHGVAETARRLGVSRQRVDQVIDRWAPELKGHLKPPVSREHHRFQQQPARTVLVSFRLSKKEWSRLATSEVNAAGPGLSPYEKAREIVLKFIATPGDGGHETAANLLNPPAPTLSHTIVNVDIQKAA